MQRLKCRIGLEKMGNVLRAGFNACWVVASVHMHAGSGIRLSYVKQIQTRCKAELTP